MADAEKKFFPRCIHDRIRAGIAFLIFICAWDSRIERNFFLLYIPPFSCDQS